MSYFSPVTSTVLTVLAPEQRASLTKWSKNHSNLFDLRLHSMRTCPFLAYTPAYFTMKHDSVEWAAWLYEFFKAKHEEEDHCNCG